MSLFRSRAQDDRDATEFLESVRPDDWDGTTIEFTGASGTGLPDSDAPRTAYPPYLDPAPAPIAPLRSQPRYNPPGPDTFPALPGAPARRPDCAIFTILPGGGFGLLCGIDRWRRHADPETTHARHTFDALRASALAAGWRPDAYGRWACPRCKMDPAYATPQPLAHWHPGGAGGRGRMITGHGGYRDAQFWLQAEAEHEVLRRTADGARHGRHRTVTR